jgi:hypothetical protein
MGVNPGLSGEKMVNIRLYYYMALVFFILLNNLTSFCIYNLSEDL